MLHPVHLESGIPVLSRGTLGLLVAPRRKQRVEHEPCALELSTLRLLANVNQTARIDADQQRRITIWRGCHDGESGLQEVYVLQARTKEATVVIACSSHCRQNSGSLGVKSNLI